MSDEAAKPDVAECVGAIPGPADAQPEKPAFRFPIVPICQLVVDENSGQVWLGMNLAVMSKLEAVCQLDQAKAHLLAVYKKRELAPKLHPGQAAALHLRNGLRRMMGR